MTRASVPAYESSTRAFTTSVAMTADGVWVAIVDFGVGATLTRLFDNEQDAGAYGGKLAVWLATRPAEWIRG
jgi:hypothetical protein